ncbi:MAG TPA: hypothetical protein VGN51_08305, partial [Acidimicrobiia bacterium]
MQFDLATLLAQWAAGGLLFCWVTTRRREVGIGYGWLLRSSFAAMAILSVVAGVGDAGTGALVRNVCTGLMALAAGIALLQSYVRRAAGVRGQRETRERRSARVAAMTAQTDPDEELADGDHEPLPEFDPRLDLLAPIIGFAGLFGAAAFVGGDYALSVARLVVGAAFLGAVSDAMLLGHWYLVQPGLGREPIKEMVKAVGALWPFELVVWLIPVGMVSVLNGNVDDGYGGLMGWMWVVAS